MAPGGQILSSLLNISFLAGSSSMIASMTKSAFFPASSSLTVV